MLVAGVSAAGAALAVISAVSVPRTTRDPAVDAQNAVSALSKHTFAWIRPLLDRARAKDKTALQVDDLPALARSELAKHLHGRFNGGAKPLWRRVIADHRSAITTQWALTGVESFLLMGPQVCLFKLLRLLEHKDTSHVDTRQLWLWAVSLAILKITHLFCETWYVWTTVL